MSTTGAAMGHHHNAPWNVKWKLGDMGEVLRHRAEEGENVSSIDDLMSFLKDTKDDEKHAESLLTALENALTNVRANGLNQQTVVAVESLRPNTVPTAIQRCMTSNFSNVHKHETVAALESYAEYGRWGIILLLIAVAIKVLNWVVNKGDVPGGGRDFEAETNSYIQAMNERLAGQSGTREKIQSQIDDVAILQGLKSVTVAASALEAKDKNNSKSKELATAATLLDALIAETNMDGVITALSVARNKKPIFTTMFKRIVDGDIRSADVPVEAVRALLDTGLANTIYAPSVVSKVMGAWPKALQQAGIRLPASETQKRFSMTIKNLANQTDNLARSADSLGRIQAMTGPVSMNDREVVTFLETFIEAVETTDICVNGVVYNAAGGNMKPAEYIGHVGILTKPDTANNLYGYETDSNAEGHMVYSWMTGHSYLSAPCLDGMLNDGKLNNNDMKAIMASFQYMLPDNVDENKGNISQYRALLQKFEGLKKKVEEMAKKDSKLKTQGPGIKEVNAQLQRRLVGAGTAGHGQYNRFMANTDEEGNASVYGAFKSVLRITRDMLKCGAVIQQSVDRHNKSPFVKVDK